jgi:uncharacterized protein YutE (UPF0331/DUF86 family)
MIRLSTNAFLLSLFLFVVAGASVYVLARSPDNVSLQQVLPFVIGFLGYQSVQFLYLTLASHRRKNTIQYNREIIELAEDDIHEITSNQDQLTARNYIKELDLHALAGHDKKLALAKLRMEIERMLRDIAESHDLLVSAGRTHSVSLLAKTLARQKILPESILAAIQEVASVCNQAVHGYEVDNDQAEQIIAAGEDLLIYLSGLRDKHEVEVG